MMKESEIDVCLVTETHERRGVRVKGIPGFERLGKRRGIGGKKGGGIAIYIREGIMGTEINWGKDMTAEWEKSEAFNEIEWVEAVLGGEKTAVGVVYMGREGVDREWNDRIMEWLRRQIQELQQRGCRLILGGDFNGHIGNGEQGIKGNKEEINVNGRRVLELAKDKELEIVNMGGKCRKVDKDGRTTGNDYRLYINQCGEHEGGRKFQSG